MADREDVCALDGAESKFMPLDLKNVGVDGDFEGYASLFGREDLGRDVVLRGAFADSLARRGARGGCGPPADALRRDEGGRA